MLKALHELRYYVWELEIENKDLRIMCDRLREIVDAQSCKLNEANETLLQEIAAFRRTEKALMDSESSFNQAQELAHVGNWRWEINEDKIFWSDETYRLFDRQPGEDINFNRYLNAVLPDDREFVKKEVSKALEEIRPYENEHRISRNGEIRFHHTTGKTFRDEDGNPVRMVGTVQDITERKIAEEKLRNLNAWREAIFHGSRDAVFVSDSESRFVMVNHAACLITGYSEKELLQMTIPDLHEVQDLHAYLLFHDRIMNGEEVLSEARILKKDGSKVDAEFNKKEL